MMINTICYNCRKVYAYKLKGRCPGCDSGNTKCFVELDDVRESVEELKDKCIGMNQLANVLIIEGRLNKGNKWDGQVTFNKGINVALKLMYKEIDNVFGKDGEIQP